MKINVTVAFFLLIISVSLVGYRLHERNNIHDTNTPTRAEKNLVHGSKAYYFSYDNKGKPYIKTNCSGLNCVSERDLELSKAYINDELKNEIYVDDNGQKRINENVGQFTLGGSLNYRKEGQYENDNYLVFSTPLFDNSLDRYNSTNFKSDFIYKNWFWDVTIDNEYITKHDKLKRIYFSISKSRLNGLTINEYLSQNPLTVTYELAVKNNRLVQEIENIDRPADVLKYEHVDYEFVGSIIYNDFSTFFTRLEKPINAVFGDENIWNKSQDYVIDRVSDMMYDVTILRREIKEYFEGIKEVLSRLNPFN